MKQRVADVLKIVPPEGDYILDASGTSVPSDGTAGYATGCLYRKTDGSAGTAIYVNEGSGTSSAFVAIAAMTAAQEALLGATAGTAEASKALIVDASIDIDTINNLGVDGTATLAKLAYATAARTASADGTGTGTIADAGMLQFVTVTSAGANNIIVLPTPTPGSVVILAVGANGYELRSSAPATVAINGGSGAAVESAIPANSTVVAICETATTWKAFQMASDGTLAQVEAAA